MSISLPKILFLIATSTFLTQTRCLELVEKEWWETALVYQIWPRAFQDSDGDGEGDIAGIITRLDYIEELGVDTIWLNPIYSSPWVDSGYDVSNYTDIHPTFGNLAEFEVLVQQAHARELKIILEVVPNHSSDKHEWFLLSEEEVEQYRDYYIWADGSVDDNGTNVPPNNWVSTYNPENGSAWSWSWKRQQWYYHKFHETQPDLNLRNELVIEELLGVFDFWLGKGVDGFRLNAVPYFFENKDLGNETSTGNGTFGLTESTSLLYTFRSYIDDWVVTNNSTSKMLLAESYDVDENLILYYGNETHDGIPPFNMRFITHINNDSDAQTYKSILDQWLGMLPDNRSTNWVISNHDHSRAATRIGLNRIDGLHMLSFLLPGQAFTYYGEEIAMLDTRITWSETRDPMACAKTNKTFEEFSRDPARTPMQWNSDVSAGFSTNDTTYLPLHPDYMDRNVEAQRAQNRSNLNTYKQLAMLRKNPVFTHGDYQLTTLNNDHVLLLERSLKNHITYIVVINVGLRTEVVNLTKAYPKLEDPLEIVVASSNAIYTTGNVSRERIVLSANAALVLEGHEIEEATEPSPPSSSTDEVSSTSTDKSSEPVTSPTISTTHPSVTTQRPSSSTQNVASFLTLSIILVEIAFFNF